MDSNRTEQHRRNEKLEALLKRINELLAPVENDVLENYRMPKYPVVLIVGCARSGSTLLMQYLASTGLFAYPTNLLSRFYAAPYVGALVQQLLTDPAFNFNDEFVELMSELSFDSELGKTQGVLSPNEFWYFWRRFFQYGEIQYLDEDALEEIDGAKFVAEIAAIEDVFNKPLIMKAHIASWNIPFADKLFDKVLFIDLRRDPLFNAQSLLKAREKYFGDQNKWYSFKPREYAALKERDPYTQVAGQVYFINKAIEDGLSKVSRSRQIRLSYEELCANPRKVLEQIVKALAGQGLVIPGGYHSGPRQFRNANQKRMANSEFNKLAAAVKEIVANEGSFQR